MEGAYGMKSDHNIEAHRPRTFPTNRGIMNMKILGVILVGIGVLALVYGGINYTKKKSVLDLGRWRSQPLNTSRSRSRRLSARSC